MNFNSFIIFGGCGFIGTHMANLLRAKYPDAKVYIADIQADGSEFSRWVDVRKPINMSGEIDKNSVIFNFASVDNASAHSDQDYFETNVRGAENVCNFARKHGIENIVFTSSIAPYGTSEELKTEDTLPTPNTPYGVSKLVAERIHREWAAENENRRLSIVRPGIVFGAGERGDMTRLYNALKSHRFAYAGRDDSVKACIYVKDLVRIMLDMAESSGPSKPEQKPSRVQLYNCCYYPSFTIGQIAQTMLEATGLKRHIPFIPRLPMMAVATLCGTSARVKNAMMSSNIDGSKLSQNYPLSYSLKEAYCDWYKDCGRKGLE